MLNRSLFAFVFVASLTASIFANNAVDQETANSDVSVQIANNFLGKEDLQPNHDANNGKSWVKYVAYLAPGAALPHDVTAHKCSNINNEHQGPSLGKVLMSGLAAYNIIQGLLRLASESPCVGICAAQTTRYLSLGAIQTILASVL